MPMVGESASACVCSVLCAVCYVMRVVCVVLACLHLCLNLCFNVFVASNDDGGYEMRYANFLEVYI
jgi:hypothetical protein